MPNMSFDFTGRSAIVTGAARGIGLAIARHFHAAGATVFMVDLDEAALTEAASEIGAIAVAADITRSADADAVVSTAVNHCGRVDILINNAGILRDRVLWKLTDDDWDQVLAVHAGGTFRLTRACVPHFRAQHYGRIVNVTSYTGLHGNRGQANYATAKAGIVGLRRPQPRNSRTSASRSTPSPPMRRRG
jgi:3-oxoacyl-[acyl-carrier protein] reductase